MACPGSPSGLRFAWTQWPEKYIAKKMMNAFYVVEVDKFLTFGCLSTFENFKGASNARFLTFNLVISDRKLLLRRPVEMLILAVHA